jgi:acyl carrier protein
MLLCGSHAAPLLQMLREHRQGARPAGLWSKEALPPEGEPHREALVAWLNGAFWPELLSLPRSGAGPVALPPYPYHRRRYWLDPNAHLRRGPLPQADADPILGQRIEQPGSAVVFARPWRAGEDQHLDEHRIGGMRVMPAALFMSMAERAGRFVLEDQVPEFSDYVFGGSVVLGDGQERTLYTRVEGEGASWRIGIWSRPSQDPPSPWHRHLSVRVQAATPASIGLADSLGLSQRKIQRQLGERLERDAFYAECAASGFAYRGAHRRVHQQSQHPGHAYVIMSVRRCFPWRPILDEAWAWFRLQRAEGEILEGDLHVVDADGELLLLVEGCLAQRLPLERIAAVDAAGVAEEGTLDLDLMPEARFYEGLDPEQPSAWDTLLAERIAELVGAVLAMPPGERIDPDQPLREAGFDSLVNARFVAAMERASGLELPLTLYMEYPTVAGLASYLAGLNGVARKVREYATASSSGTALA